MSVPEGTIAIPVSPGELLDKISILEIKAARIADPAKLQAVLHELDLLRTAREKHIAASVDLASCVAELRTTNESLWDIENRIRDCERRGDFGPDFVDLARSVYQFNDRRAALKRAINELSGSAFAEVKLYSSY